MEQLMCLSCGEFVPAYESDDGLVPQAEECPDCGGREFKHVATETVLSTDG